MVSEETLISFLSSVSSPKKTESYLFNKDYKRWDLIFLFYMLSIFMTTASFGASHNSQYNQIIFFFVFLHFAAESTVSWNFIFSAKVANYLSIFTGAIYLLQACVTVPLVSDVTLLRALAAVEFVFSDTLSAVSSICIVLNRTTCHEIRRAAAVVSFHFVGVSLTLWVLPIIWYFNNTIPQLGEGWVLIGLSSLPQFYYVKEILQSKMNHVSNEKGIEWQSQRFKIVSQILSVVIPMLGVILFAFLSINRTTESYNPLVFASGVWAYVILIMGYPLGCFCAILLLYWWRKGRAMYKYERSLRMISVNESDDKDSLQGIIVYE